MEANIIKDGDFVIMKTDTVLRLVELKKSKPQFVGRRKAHIFSAVGHSYGSFFEITSDGSLIKLENHKDSQNLLFDVMNDTEMKDNRSLTDTGESQKLTTSDIESFKRQGMSGQEMVRKIVENSSSFHEKTAFAKEKYLRKKQKKYLTFVQLLKPNIRLLVQMYYMQGPVKICNLRIDSLSQMLAFCNVMSGGKYMVIDTALGLLTASVLERLGSEGCVVQLHLGPFSVNVQQQVIKALNISETLLSSLLFNVDFKTAVNLLNDPHYQEDDSVTMDVDTFEVVSQITERNAKSEKKKHVNKTINILEAKSMDSLLLAVKNHPANALKLLDFLSFSRPFAFFSMYQQPLVDCYVQLKTRDDIISVNISETWLREYQVLPDRTHPHYNMSGSGGFLLTGIKVEPKTT